MNTARRQPTGGNQRQRTRSTGDRAPEEWFHPHPPKSPYHSNREWSIPTQAGPLSWQTHAEEAQVSLVTPSPTPLPERHAVLANEEVGPDEDSEGCLLVVSGHHNHNDLNAVIQTSQSGPHIRLDPTGCQGITVSIEPCPNFEHPSAKKDFRIPWTSEGLGSSLYPHNTHCVHTRTAFPMVPRTPRLNPQEPLPVLEDIPSFSLTDEDRTWDDSEVGQDSPLPATC